MGTFFMPLSAIIAILIIAFLFASLPQVNHQTRYRMLYAIVIIMLLAVIPISEYMARDTKNSNNNYLLVLIFYIGWNVSNRSTPYCLHLSSGLTFSYK
jgi:chromate transport protein ChrA